MLPVNGGGGGQIRSIVVPSLNMMFSFTLGVDGTYAKKKSRTQKVDLWVGDVIFADLSNLGNSFS